MSWSKINFESIESAMKSLGFIHVENSTSGGPPVTCDELYFYNPKIKEGIYMNIGGLDDELTFEEQFALAVHRQFGEGHGMTQDGVWFDDR